MLINKALHLCTKLPLLPHLQVQNTESPVKMLTKSSFLLVCIFIHDSSSLPNPLMSHNVLSVFQSLGSAQQCGLVGCKSPIHGGHAFCRSLNQGRMSCAPNPRAMVPFATFTCVGTWQQSRSGGAFPDLNVSVNTSVVRISPGTNETRRP